MKIKIITIRGLSPEDRAKQIEEINNLNENIICKGSIYYELEERRPEVSNLTLKSVYHARTYCADVIFVQGETEIKLPKSEPVEEVTRKPEPKTTETTTSKAPFNSNFKPTEEQLERWKKIKVTKKTYGLLLAKGFSKEDIKSLNSQYDAFIALQSIKEEYI